MDLRNPPGRAEKSINFLCCDHSVSDVKIDCCKRASISSNADHKLTHPEVSRKDLELGPWNGHTFDKGMFLVFERQHGFVEDNAFILFSKHAHEAFHEVLRCR